ncbi:MAG TPA: rRNA maturation RNase YbeY [Gemmatimonadales bacterium]|nr:rRNA maturation RNase YbeY [Gemmatimonadales bacterium]
MAPDVTVGGRPALPPASVRRVVRAVVAAERPRRPLTQLSITFLGPLRMRRLNRRHLHHDRVTDVIAFALRLPDGALAGDVYVCRAVADRQAREAGRPLREELIRLIIHGTLHVLGHDHPAGPGRMRSAMWHRQERLVGRLA